MSKSRGKQTESRQPAITALAAAVLKGDPRAGGRVLSFIESRNPLAKEIMKRLYSRTGDAHIVGITGAAGSGKSTLIGCLTAELRRRKRKVGVLTVDPSSPFSGGALLGDRIRMRDHFLDKGVFIRSLATRGGQGGLSSCIGEAVQLLDAMGKDCVLIETIGIGQDQVEVSRIAHTVVVIITPESGDEVQAMKAGIFEVADLLVVNKADLSGADELFSQLRNLLGDAGVPILKVSAIHNEGIAALIDGIEAHRARLLASGNHKQKILEVSRSQLEGLVLDALMAKIKNRMEKPELEHWARQIAERHSDPYTAAEKILERMGF
jgi:LAO/AO transport system kinase